MTKENYKEYYNLLFTYKKRTLTRMAITLVEHCYSHGGIDKQGAIELTNWIIDQKTKNIKLFIRAMLGEKRAKQKIMRLDLGV